MSEARPQTANEVRPVIRRKPKLNVWQSLAVRGLLVLALFGVALAGHWLDRDGLKDNIDGEISFLDVVYFTTITVTTVGYGDIVPVSDRARMFDTFVVTPVRIFVWVIFLGTAYTFVLRSTWERIRTAMIGKTLNGHTIICGFGAGGEYAAKELLCSGWKADRIIVIDSNPERVRMATELGFNAIEGDATHNAVLSAARIEEAAAVLVATNRDDVSALVVLSARQLNHSVAITTGARAQENEDLLSQAGASVVLNPVRFGGHLLARAATAPHAVDTVADLVSYDRRMVLRERTASEREIGQSLRDVDAGIAIRLVRQGVGYCAFDQQAARIEDGDIIVEIVEAKPQPA